MTLGTNGTDDPARPLQAVQLVRAAQARLAETEGQPVAAHIEVYDDVHDVLQGALAELDEA